MRRGEQIGPAHDVGDARCRVVDDDRQVVGDADVLARKHRIAPAQRVGRDRSARGVAPRQRSCARDRPRDVEPPGDAVVVAGPPHIATTAGARIYRDSPMRRALGDFGPSADARIEQSRGAQRVERGRVSRRVAALQLDPVPSDAEPIQILDDPVDEGGARPTAIDVLEAQQEASAVRSGRGAGGERRIGMAQVQSAGGGRRETRHHIL